MGKKIRRRGYKNNTLIKFVYFSQ